MKRYHARRAITEIDSRLISGHGSNGPLDGLASSSSIVIGSMDTLGGQARVVPRTLLQTGGAGG